MFALVALLLVACSKGHSGARDDGSNGGSSSVPTAPQPGCLDADYSLCDIRDADCQTRIAGLAACLRGNEPLDIHIDVLTEDEYTQQRLDEIAALPSSQLYHFYRVLALLDLSSGTVGSLAGGVGGFVKKLGGVYEPDKKRIVIVDHGVPADTADIDGVLLHESIHALQDADYDLTTWFANNGDGTFDRTLSLKSIVEGEARFYEMRAAVPFNGYSPRGYDYPHYFLSSRQDILARVFESPSAYDDSFLTFPYAMGASLIDSAWLVGGPRGDDPLWASPPLTTQRVIAEVLQLDTPQETGVEIADPMPTGLSLDSQDSLGAWGLALFHSIHGASVSAAQAHGMAWRGDHFWVYTDDAHLEYGLWQVELESAAEARAFDAVAAKLGGNVEHGSSGARAFVSVGVEGTSAEATAAGQSWLAAK